MTEAGDGLDCLRTPLLVATPFQSAGWIEAFRAGFHETEFHMLSARDGKGMFHLPLAVRREGAFRVADIIGGKHASYHAPAFERGVMPERHALALTLKAAGAQLGVDCFAFTDCPVHIDGEANPLRALAHQPSPSFASELTIEADADALMTRLLDRDDRKKLRQKEKKLAEAFGPVSACFLTDPAEISAALRDLRQWKAARFGEKGIDDPFASPQAGSFLARATAGASPPMRVFALRAGARRIAVMVGAMHEARFSGMANANDPDPAIMKSSPGDLIILHLVRQLANDGLRHFDLGVGEARYKSRWCPDVLPLFDCAVPVTMKGSAHAALFLARRSIKRGIKQSGAGMALVQRLRQIKARFSRDRS